MLFLFPRRCIRTRLEFLAEIEDVTLVAEGSAGRGQTSPADIRAGTRASSPLLVSTPRRFFHFFVVRRASFGANLRPPAASIVRNSRRETARRLDFTRVRPKRSFEFQLSPLLLPPRIRSRRGKGENDFARFEKLCFEDKVKGKKMWMIECRRVQSRKIGKEENKKWKLFFSFVESISKLIYKNVNEN